ncbi:hypothetical protein C8Q80DRAFT_1079133, partial [Daedaleopsis nitida]
KHRHEAQLLSTRFVLAAGAVPFHFDAAGAPRRVLLAYHTPRATWLLAKGRKDAGEDLAAAATREVTEETGYPCRLHVVPRMPTCAPAPSLEAGEFHFEPHAPRIAENSTEPFMLTLRPLEGGSATGLGSGMTRMGTENGMLKLIFWYIGAVDVPYDPADATMTAMKPGSHQLAEGFGEVRLFDIPEALERLGFEGDRELVRTAVAILT